MAKQLDLYKLRGTIGDITFYKSKDGYMVRAKGGVDGSRIKTDARFQRTRENNAEFGRAGQAGKILRNSFSAVVKQAADGRVVSRMVTAMAAVQRTDTTSERGQRNVLGGDLTLLQGFDFNEGAKLEATFYGVYRTTVDRVTGVMTIDVDAFVPQKQVSFPAAATHFRLVAAAAGVDFTTGAREMFSAESASMPLDNNYTPETSFTLALTAGTTHPVFMVLGIEFYQQMNSNQYLLRNGAFNAVGIIQVDA